MDFVRGVDLIDLSAIDANSAIAGNQGFKFTGAKPSFASAGDLSFTRTPLGSLVEGDPNGGEFSGFRILEVSNYTMLASDCSCRGGPMGQNGSGRRNWCRPNPFPSAACFRG